MGCNARLAATSHAVPQVLEEIPTKNSLVNTEAKSCMLIVNVSRPIFSKHFSFAVNFMENIFLSLQILTKQWQITPGSQGRIHFALFETTWT